ncbi:MAG: TldD/PmbA family protein [bacterium]
MSVDEARRHILDRARAHGISAEVVGQRRRDLTARASQGRLEQLTQAVSGGVGVRVDVDGRVGYAYTEELSPEALDWMLDEAIENASLQERGEAFLPAGSPLGHQDLVGKSFDAPLQAKIQAALGFEGTLREDKRVMGVELADYDERVWDISVASTEGADGSYRRGAAGLSAFFVMQDGASRKQGWDRQWVTDLASLDPGRTALEFTERTGRLLGARPLATGRYPAYFEPKAFIDLLAAFSPMWSGKAVMEGKSRLAGRLGEAISAPILTLVDDPTMRAGLATRPFDAEATPARPLTLIEDGVLRAYLTNSEVARALRLENTGHAARGYRGTLTVAPSNLYVRPLQTGSGLKPQRGVLITEVSGVHAGASAITGQFSLQGLGLWVEGGEVAYPVENFAVAGDFLTLLREITGLGESLEWKMWGGTALGAPLVGVAELSFAGI